MKRPRAFYHDFDTFARVLSDGLAASVPATWTQVVRGLLDGDIVDVVDNEMVASERADADYVRELEEREADRLAKYRGFYRSLVARSEMKARERNALVDELADQYEHEVLLICTVDLLVARDTELTARLSEAIERASDADRRFVQLSEAMWEIDIERVDRCADVCRLLAGAGVSSDPSVARGLGEACVSVREGLREMSTRAPAPPSSPDASGEEYLAYAKQYRVFAEELAVLYVRDLGLIRQVAPLLAAARVDQTSRERWLEDGLVQVERLSRYMTELLRELTNGVDVYMSELAEHSTRVDAQNAEFTSVTTPEDAAEARAVFQRAVAVWRSQLEGTTALLDRARGLPIAAVFDLLDQEDALLRWWQAGIDAAFGTMQSANHLLAAHDHTRARLAEVRQQAEEAIGELHAGTAGVQDVIASNRVLAIEFEKMFDSAEALEARTNRFVQASAYAQLPA